MAGKKNDARRVFLSRLGTGALAAGAFGASAGPLGTTLNAQAPAGGTRAFQPARHSQDDWLDQIPGSHRFILDTTTPAGIDSALLYVNNYYIANGTDYGLKDSDLAVVIVVRHDSTSFAFNDGMWAKYGQALAKRNGFVDPGTRQTPAVNVYRNRLEPLIKRGMRLAVCQMATRRLAATIVEGGGADADKAYAELTANLLPNSHMVPAGIVCVNRAQERGYAFAHAV